MTSFAHIRRGSDFVEADIRAAVADRDSFRALLERLAVVARPGEGAARALLVFARMASTACDWLDGDLSIELVGDATTTVIDVLSDLGGGLRERVVAPVVLGVPLGELAAAIDRAPHALLPLAMVSRTERRVVLGATAGVRRSSLAPPIVALEALTVPFPPPARIDPGGMRGRVPLRAIEATVRVPNASELPIPREPSLRPAPNEPDPSGADEPPRR